MILCCNDFGTHIDLSVEIIYINSSVYFQLNIDDELVELGRENFMFKHPYSICFLGVTILKLWYLTGVNYVLLGTILWILRLLILLIHNQLVIVYKNFHHLFHVLFHLLLIYYKRFHYLFQILDVCLYTIFPGLLGRDIRRTRLIISATFLFELAILKYCWIWTETG